MDIQSSSDEFELGLKNRMQVLQYSLLIEMSISGYLALLVGVKLDNIETSQSFGNKSSALSFNQKLNLLIDIGALDKEVKRKFINFAEIRNQFMHNSKADSFEACLSYTEIKDKFLFETYPQPTELLREDRVRGAVMDLAEDVYSKTNNLLDNVRDKIKNDQQSILNKHLLTSYEFAVANAELHLNILFKETKNSEGIPLKGLGSTVKDVIVGLAKKKFEELSAGGPPSI